MDNEEQPNLILLNLIELYLLNMKIYLKDLVHSYFYNNLNTTLKIIFFLI